ncbi:MAG: hypothetical protein D6785_04700, partial [Planctomycetota bacterium]
LVLFTAIHVEKPLHFSAFPSLLLLATLFRLALNISTTRLILSQAHEKGVYAAGKVISTFGKVMAANQLVVGLVLFGLILVVHYFVITKGADRISEVMARFMLDGLPGKQLGVDRDCTSGVLSKEEAEKKKEDILQESNFFASMDGAMKFIKGDALASLIITLINLLGGLILGLFYYSMSFSHTLEVFSKLTIGDGLVSMIPSLLNALSAGILLSRVSGRDLLASEVHHQLFKASLPLMVTASVLVLFLLTPLPKIPLLFGSVILFFLAYQEKAKTSAYTPSVPFHKEHEKIEELTQLETLEIQLGFKLVKLVDEGKGGLLGRRIMEIRKRFAEELGLIIPPVAIGDNLSLRPKNYQILIRGNIVAEGTLYPDKFLAVNPGRDLEPLNGIEVLEPVYKMKGIWISVQDKEKAEELGYQVFSAYSVLASHFQSTILNHLDKILTLKQVLQIIERARKDLGKLVDEAIPAYITAGKLKAILQELLVEQVPIHDIEAILETSIENSELAPIAIAEEVRSRLVGTLLQKYRNKEGHIPLIKLSQETELLLSENLNDLDKKQIANLLHLKIYQIGTYPVVCSGKIRRDLRDMLRSKNLDTPVFSYREIGHRQILIKGEIQIGELFLTTSQNKAG